MSAETLLDAARRLRNALLKTAPRPARLPALSEATAHAMYKSFLNAERDHHRYTNFDWFRAGITMRERLDGHDSQFPKGTK